MIYVTTRQKTREKQLSWLDLIEDKEFSEYDLCSSGSAGTVTRVMEQPTEELLRKINVPYMIDSSNKKTTFLRNKIRHEIIFAIC